MNGSPGDGARGISVIVPCLNEEASIGRVVDDALAGIARLNLPGEVLVVDNGSTDRSAEVASRRGAQVIAERHRGYGAALRRGFAEARYEVLVMGDGDLSYDLTRLDELAAPVLRGEADFVIGNRMRNIRPGAMPTLHRYLGNPALSLILRILFHTRAVRDAHCGMRAISRSAYRRLRCVTTGMEFASEMVVRALDCGLRIRERDIQYHPRVGESKLASFRDGWRHLRFMLLHSPTWALLLPGAAAWVLGIATAAPIAFGPVVIRGRAFDIHFMIMAGLLNAVSIQLITMGLLAKAYAHLSGLREDPVIAWLYRRLTFERVMLAAVPLILVGFVLALLVMGRWIASGFGPLNEARRMFFAMLCLFNGCQVASAGYLFSIMALPRYIETAPPDVGGGS